MLALAALVATGCATTSAHPAGLTATRQVYITPVRPDGSQVSSFAATSVAARASCIPGSEAIGQAYRCFAGNHIYDPCWAVKTAAPTVLCLEYPWSVTAARLSVTGQLSPIPYQGGIGEPWGVELADGRRCVLLQGAHPVYDGRIVDYYCSPQLFLLRGLAKTSPVWRASSVIQRAGKTAAGPVEQIQIAWFGRADTFR